MIMKNFPVKWSLCNMAVLMFYIYCPLQINAGESSVPKQGISALRCTLSFEPQNEQIPSIAMVTLHNSTKNIIKFIAPKLITKLDMEPSSKVLPTLNGINLNLKWGARDSVNLLYFTLDNSIVIERKEIVLHPGESYIVVCKMDDMMVPLRCNLGSSA